MVAAATRLRDVHVAVRCHRDVARVVEARGDDIHIGVATTTLPVARFRYGSGRDGQDQQEHCGEHRCEAHDVVLSVGGCLRGLAETVPA